MEGFATSTEHGYPVYPCSLARLFPAGHSTLHFQLNFSETDNGMLQFQSRDKSIT